MCAFKRIAYLDLLFISVRSAITDDVFQLFKQYFFIYLVLGDNFLFRMYEISVIIYIMLLIFY